MNHIPSILLSFDVEEFDMPLEYGQQVPEKEQLSTGYQGLETLMNVMDPFAIQATYFTTANFAQHYPEAIRSISLNNEIASHTFYHSRFETNDLARSKRALEEIISKEISGLRMPRMRTVDMKDVKAAGYSYDSSVNPAYVPGRYNNRHLPRTSYLQEQIWRIPASVSPRLRIPLFWLSFKNLPYSAYIRMVRSVLKKDGYVCLYFHPWEFIPLDHYKLPFYARKHAGPALQKRLARLIGDLQLLGNFTTMARFSQENLQ